MVWENAACVRYQTARVKMEMELFHLDEDDDDDDEDGELDGEKSKTITSWNFPPLHRLELIELVRDVKAVCWQFSSGNLSKLKPSTRQKLNMAIVEARG